MCLDRNSKHLEATAVAPERWPTTDDHVTVPQPGDIVVAPPADDSILDNQFETQGVTRLVLPGNGSRKSVRRW